MQYRILSLMLHGFILRVDVARSITLRYWESMTVKLRNSSKGISIRLPIYLTRQICPFCWKKWLNSAESILKQLSSNSASQLSEISSDGTFQRMKDATEVKQSTTTSPILSFRCVTTTYVNFLMAVINFRLALLATIFQHYSNAFKIYKLASSSAYESSPLYVSSSLSRPISMQVIAEYDEQLAGFDLLGRVNDGLPRLGLQGLGMWVPGWSWLLCFPFL